MALPSRLVRDRRRGAPTSFNAYSNSLVVTSPTGPRPGGNALAHVGSKTVALDLEATDTLRPADAKINGSGLRVSASAFLMAAQFGCRSAAWTTGLENEVTLV